MVAVSDTFDQIHTDWNWIEQNLFRQIGELDASAVDDFLLAKFEEAARQTTQASGTERPPLLPARRRPAGQLPLLRRAPTFLPQRRIGPGASSPALPPRTSLQRRRQRPAKEPGAPAAKKLNRRPFWRTLGSVTTRSWIVRERRPFPVACARHRS